MRIYLDVDGTLIHDSLGPRFGQPAAGLPEFIAACSRFEVYWLSMHCQDGDIKRVCSLLESFLPSQLHETISHFRPVTWTQQKSEALDWTTDFLWIDDRITFDDEQLFAEANPNQRFIRVNLAENPATLLELTGELRQLAETTK